jgi:RNase P/RNase MRP subunit p29
MQRHGPATYAIWVSGAVSAEWEDRLGGLHVRRVRSSDQPMTELVGAVVDQTALAGVLSTLYELGLPIVSVERLIELDPHDQLRHENQ